MSTAYDEIPYPGQPYRETHPLRLGVAPALLGLPYAPAEACRVLEIACGDGANILPMAASFPGSRFVGFDLAASAVERGRAAARALGLSNLKLEVLDLLEAGAELGQFDYIIAHGVYAWAPQPVREAVLRLIGACLSPQGVAFVSYNALPGAYLRHMMRDMLLFHLRTGAAAEKDQLGAAIAFLGRFVELAPDDEPTSVVMKAYAKAILARRREVLFHDELGSVYEPVYFAEFIAQARRHGLDFLAGAEGPSWREELFPTALGQAVAELSGDDRVLFHQYRAFFTGRAFHETLLRRAGPALDRTVDAARLRGLYAAAPVTAEVEGPDPGSDAEVKFQFGSKRSIRIGHPQIKAALRALGTAWPQAVAIAELPAGPDLEEALLQLFTAGQVELQTGPWPLTTEPGERPLASPLARAQISLGREMVTSLEHAAVMLTDDPARYFLSLLDGGKNREALAQHMAERLRQPLEEIRPTVEPHLAQLGRLALLMA